MKRVDAVLESLYAKHVNAQQVRVLELFRMNETYARCEGAELQG